MNHPSVRHLCEDLDSVDPRKEVEGNLDLLAASPECTHHSNARGGVPCSDQSRSTAWHVLRWMDAKQPKGVMIENIKEFQDWGPLLDKGITWRGKYYKKDRPDPRRKGQLFKAFTAAISAMNYSYEYRILNAADYGDATSRNRLIMLMLRGNKRIVWPDITHQPKAWGKYKQHRAAKDIIDWSLKGRSIYERKKPLAPNTMKRIMDGLKKFGGESFVISMEHGGRLHNPNNPMPTITTADGFAVCQPFLVKLYGTGKTASVDAPCPTITAGGNHIGLAEPFILKYYGTGGCSSINDPLDTITTKDRFLLVMPDGSKAQLDIRFRMLQPHELSAAMGFPADYEFSGTREERVKQIGNAVPVNLAEAVATSLLNVTLN
jgi:DNA (cytosine-5)-methyltransferase 1